MSRSEPRARRPQDLQAFSAQKAAADCAFGAARYQEAASAYKRAASAASSDDIRAACLKDAGVALRLRGDVAAAESIAREARALVGVERSGLFGEITLLLGNCLADRREFDGARGELAGAAETFRALNDAKGFAQAILANARVLAETGATAESIQFYEELLPLPLPASFQTQVLNNLALLYRRVGRMNAAAELLSRDIALCREAGDIYGEAVALYNSANLLVDAQRSAEATVRLGEAADRFERIGRLDERDQALALRSQLSET